MDVVKTWTISPTPFGQHGLFQATQEKLQALKERHERQVALSTEMDKSGVPVEAAKKASDAASSSGTTAKGKPGQQKKKA